jgi:hypothetical protein
MSTCSTSSGDNRHQSAASTHRLPDEFGRCSVRDRDDAVDLKRRLDDLRLSRAHVRENADEVNDICNRVLQRLKDSSPNTKRLYPYSFRWEKMPAGSYYEKVKIDKPNEYDCLFTCEIRACVLFYDCPSKSFCALRLPSGTAADVNMTCSSDRCDFLCPKAFKDQFREKIEIILSELNLSGLKIVLKRHDHKNPAVTLEVERGGSNSYSIDLVPAVRLVEWPKTADEWTSPWLGTEKVNEIKSKYPCVVPKIHPNEFPSKIDDCRFWRLSFTAAEKQIILHADGTHAKKRDSSSSGSGKSTCRKDVLRLLKEDLNKFRRIDPGISSYDLKTIFLHLLDDKPEGSDWATDKLINRYVDALAKVIDSIKRKTIRHYFVDENLFDMKLTQADVAKVLTYFETKFEHYKRFVA